MDYFRSQTQYHPTKFNKRLTQEQINLLEASFTFNNKLDSAKKSQLSQELGLPSRQIAIWYQNRRARWKNQSLEFDYESLKKRLKSALFDNERLGKEVYRLNEELEKTKEAIILLNSGGYDSSMPSISNSCDEVGTSGLEKYDNHLLDKDLFACFIGGERIDQLDGDDYFSPSKY